MRLSPNTDFGLEKISRFGGLAGIAAAALAVSACGAKKQDNSPPLNTKPVGPTVTVNNHGAPSAEVNAYSSPFDTAPSEILDDGEKYGALCQTEGPDVRADPDSDRPALRSVKWILVIAQPGENVFVSATQIAHPDQAMNRLQDCQALGLGNTR